MAYHSQSLGRSLSVTSLEGVQVRLGDRFKPPEKVSLPLGYKEPNPSVALNTSQYSFEVESTFLSWLETKKASDAAKEAIKLRAKEEQRAASKSPVQLPNGILQPTNFKASPSDRKTNSIPPMASVSGDIMTPVPLGSTSNSSRVPAAAQNRKQAFDLADFENNASDPFESTELETLNDLEELKSVLAFTNVPAQPGTVTTEEPLNSTDASLEVDSVPAAAAETAAVTLHTSNKHVAYKPDKPRPKPQALSSSGANGPTAQVPNTQPVLPSTSHIPRGNPDPFVRPPLPPISSTQSDSAPPAGSLQGDQSARLIGRGVAEHQPEQPVQRRSPPPSYYANDFTHSGASPVVSPIELPPSYPQTASLQPVDCTPFPDLDLENLSRYTPLPPSPHPSRTNSVDHGQASPPNPDFDAMGTEDRNFVLMIVSMGFPRSRTVKAVKQHGHDDRLVVEWLCAMDTLCSQGFQEDQVELALSLHNSNTQKAQEFLLLLQRFEELGFKSEDIKRELIVHNNNEDTVLNALTTNS